MRLLLLLAFSAFFVTPSSAQTPSVAPPEPVEVVKLEQNLWTTMAEGDFSTVRALFTPDFIQVDDHIHALDSLLITLKHCKLESYELRDLQVRVLTPDSAITAYHVVNSFNCGSADAPQTKKNDHNAVTVWVRQTNGKRWLVQAHAEAPASADTIAQK
jgi:uncharacterized protein (TIGR02246 family)